VLDLSDRDLLFVAKSVDTADLDNESIERNEDSSGSLSRNNLSVNLSRIYC